jgi:hypothetical protein
LTDPGLSGKDLYDLLRNAEYDAHPSWRHLTTTRWYKAIRRASLPLDADDEARDEAKWEPRPGDMVLAYNITVTGDGGQPHLVDGRPAELRALIRRHDPDMAGR